MSFQEKIRITTFQLEHRYEKLKIPAAYTKQYFYFCSLVIALCK